MRAISLAIVLSLVVVADARDADHPNILFIMSDDHAAHAIGAYGSRVNQTPNIDRIAREGMILTSVFVTNSICTPSRAAILTGQYSHVNGVTMFNRFDSTRADVARLLQAGGYYYHDPGDHNTRAHYGVRTRTHKLIYFWKKDQWELFDLVNDPFELHNLYGQPGQERLTATLKAELVRLKRAVHDDDQLANEQIPNGVDGPIARLRGE